MARPVAPALRALLERVIDYAGMYPPASLPREAAIKNFRAYRDSEHAWMLRCLVIGSAEVPHLPAEFDGQLAVVGETDEPRAAVIESKTIITAKRPVYCERPIADLDAVKAAGCFAKLRTGGVTPEMVPPVDRVAAFVLACAERRLPFKATAGLHHPVRSMQPLTYETSPPRAVMHGFLNLFVAAALAWHGDRDLEPILTETDPAAFRFDEKAHWRDRSLTAELVREARQQFAHSFGSCSFTEPVQGLQALGLL